MSFVTLGTDPELFVVARSGKLAGSVLPSYYALGAVGTPTDTTLETPAWWDRSLELPHGKLVGDGAAIEWTQTPTTRVDQMVANLGQNIGAIRALVERLAIDLNGSAPDPVLSAAPAVDVPWEYINALTPGYGKAFSLQILGCSPDHDVYTQSSIDRPDPITFPMRTSGGHIHLQVGESMVNDYTAICYLTGLLDRVLGCAAVSICGSAETSADFRRRISLYGRAGTIRLDEAKKAIGVVEYRTLPAIALVHSAEQARLMFDAAQVCAEFMRDLFDSQAQPMLYETFLGDFTYMNGVASDINQWNATACRAELTEFCTHGPSELTGVVRALLEAEPITSFQIEW